MSSLKIGMVVTHPKTGELSLISIIHQKGDKFTVGLCPVTAASYEPTSWVDASELPNE